MLSQVNFKSFAQQKLRVVRALGMKKILFLPSAWVYVSSLWIYSRVAAVKIFEVKNSRIGDFARDTEIAFLKTKEGNKKSLRRAINIFCTSSEKSCNFELERMWKRELNLKSGTWGWLINDLSRRYKKEGFYNQLTDVDRTGLLTKNPVSLKFTKSELKVGNDFLNATGRPSCNKFVCLNVRDSAFLSISEPIGWGRNRNWSYHDYRDSDIKTYVAAAEALAEMGYTVFRMGAIVKEPLLSNHPRVIDYATNGMRTEFLDIFLGAHCAFAVSTGSGWDEVPTIFRRPQIWVNFLPIADPAPVSQTLTIFPKILLDRDSLEVLTLQQLTERGAARLCHTQAYKDTGVVIRDLSSEELVDAVTEMAQRVKGTFIETPEQIEMQAKAKHILSTHPKLQPSPNYYPIRAQFASCFLSRYPNFLD